MHDFVVVANRLPVDQVEEPDGQATWRPSPGGLVAALEPVMRASDGAWVGWSGSPGPAPAPFDADGMRLLPVGLSEDEVASYYAGFSNATLWPLYHDVIARPVFHRQWWRAYQQVNARFAETVAAHAAKGATVWVHDYQLQLVPALLRAARPDLRIGFFNHIPFPGFEIFAQLPWRREIVEGLLGADLVGFQRQQDVTNFLRACRRAAGRTTRGASVTRGRRAGGLEAGGARRGLPDLDRLRRASRTWPAATPCGAGPRRSGSALGDPETILLGVDRLDYTKGILHRLKAYDELLAEHRLGPPSTPPWSRWRAPAASASSSTRSCGRRWRRRSAGSTASTACSATRQCTTCTTPTRGTRWRRSTWRPTSCSSPPCATA